MKFWTLALGAALAFAAGCDRNPPAIPAASALSTAGAGASTGAPDVGPKGDRIELPENPEGTQQSKALPDPGDANDHSTPAHDARAKSDSGKKSDE
jgi:hypothetical protein